MSRFMERTVGMQLTKDEMLTGHLDIDFEYYQKFASYAEDSETMYLGALGEEGDDGDDSLGLAFNGGLTFAETENDSVDNNNLIPKGNGGSPHGSLSFAEMTLTTESDVKVLLPSSSSSSLTHSVPMFMAPIPPPLTSMPPSQILPPPLDEQLTIMTTLSTTATIIELTVPVHLEEPPPPPPSSSSSVVGARKPKTVVPRRKVKELSLPRSLVGDGHPISDAPTTSPIGHPQAGRNEPLSFIQSKLSFDVQGGGGHNNNDNKLSRSISAPLISQSQNQSSSSSSPSPSMTRHGHGRSRGNKTHGPMMQMTDGGGGVAIAVTIVDTRQTSMKQLTGWLKTRLTPKRMNILFDSLLRATPSTHKDWYSQTVVRKILYTHFMESLRLLMNRHQTVAEFEQFLTKEKINPEPGDALITELALYVRRHMISCHRSNQLPPKILKFFRESLKFMATRPPLPTDQVQLVVAVDYVSPHSLPGLQAFEQMNDKHFQDFVKLVFMAHGSLRALEFVKACMTHSSDIQTELGPLLQGLEESVERFLRDVDGSLVITPRLGTDSAGIGCSYPMRVSLPYLNSGMALEEFRQSACMLFELVQGEEAFWNETASEYRVIYRMLFCKVCLTLSSEALKYSAIPLIHKDIDVTQQPFQSQSEHHELMPLDLPLIASKLLTDNNEKKEENVVGISGVVDNHMDVHMIAQPHLPPSSPSSSPSPPLQLQTKTQAQEDLLIATRYVLDKAISFLHCIQEKITSPGPHELMATTTTTTTGANGATVIIKKRKRASTTASRTKKRSTLAIAIMTPLSEVSSPSCSSSSTARADSGSGSSSPVIITTRFQEHRHEQEDHEALVTTMLNSNDDDENEDASGGEDEEDGGGGCDSDIKDSQSSNI